jgi:hypothetical protein
MPAYAPRESWSTIWAGLMPARSRRIDVGDQRVLLSGWHHCAACSRARMASPLDGTAIAKVLLIARQCRDTADCRRETFRVRRSAGDHGTRASVRAGGFRVQDVRALASGARGSSGLRASHSSDNQPKSRRRTSSADIRSSACRAASTVGPSRRRLKKRTRDRSRFNFRTSGRLTKASAGEPRLVVSRNASML